MSFVKYLIGLIGSKIQTAMVFYRGIKNEKAVGFLGNDSVISGNTKLVHPQSIRVGSNTYINGGDLIASKNAKIIIGNNCLISYNVHLRCDMHNYIDKNQLISSQGHTEKDIIIGDDVWIGYGAQILSGIKIADGCVVAAGAIVTHDTEPYCMYAGVPARLCKRRE